MYVTVPLSLWSIAKVAAQTRASWSVSQRAVQALWVWWPPHPSRISQSSSHYQLRGQRVDTFGECLKGNNGANKPLVFSINIDNKLLIVFVILLLLILFLKLFLKQFISLFMVVLLYCFWYCSSYCSWTIPDTVPDTVPVTVPDNLHDTVPDTVSDTVPNTVPHTIPDTVI